MVKYYYDKYSVQWVDSKPWVFRSSTTNGVGITYQGYRLDPITNRFSVTGKSAQSETWKPQPSYAASSDGTLVNRFVYEYINGIEQLAIYEKRSQNNTRGRGVLIQADIIAEEGTYPNDGIYTDESWYVKKGEVNQTPTITINTENNKTLYENNTFTLNGQAKDADNGQIINIRYQINAEPSKALGTGISNGTDPIIFTKTLTFKLGKLYDGNIAISNGLADGVNHTLKIWAEDEKGAKSIEQVRTFKVVANRSPVLTVNSIAQQSGLINADKIQVSGTATDPEGQNLIVQYNVNGGEYTEVHNGPGGNFTFDLSLSKLTIGDNAIIIQAVDSYNYITSKTFNISKVYNGNELLKGFARYKLQTPTAGITELVTWVERTIGDLTVNMGSSMVLTGESESFAAMAKTNTAPIDEGIEEDEFSFTAASAKTDVALKLNVSRTNVNSHSVITKIAGTYN